MDRLFDRLEDQFGRTNVFRDIDSIGPGRNFSDVIIDSLKEVDVVIAAIGATWNEGRRLSDPSDFVRMEVSHALSRGTPIIPVLLDDTDLPTSEELPADLQGLLSLNVSRVRRGADFRRDISKVVTAAQELASVERGRRAITAAEEAAEQERGRQEMELRHQREQKAALERAEREAVETKRAAIQLAQEELRVRAALRELETEYAARRMSAEARVEGLETERRHAEAAAHAAADRLARLREQPVWEDSQLSGYAPSTDVIPASTSVATPPHTRDAAADVTMAAADYDDAIRIDPTNAEAFNNRGRAREAEGDVKGAVADFNKAIRLDPNFVEALNNRGVARQAVGDFVGAIADFDKAIRLDPNFADAFRNRGLVRHNSGKLEEATADLNEAIRIDPRSARALNNRGLVRYETGNLEEALVDFDNAIDLDGDFAQAFKNRGRARKGNGDLMGAIADFRRGRELAPNDPDFDRELQRLNADS
jgi:tetratricopeptide (TPR) repeat protein